MWTPYEHSVPDGTGRGGVARPVCKHLVPDGTATASAPQRGVMYVDPRHPERQRPVGTQ